MSRKGYKGPFDGIGSEFEEIPAQPLKRPNDQAHIVADSTALRVTASPGPEREKIVEESGQDILDWESKTSNEKKR